MFLSFCKQKPRVVAMSAYKDVSGMFTAVPLEVDEDDALTEQRVTMNTSLEKVFSMEHRYFTS